MELRRTTTQPPEPPGATQAYEGAAAPAKASAVRPPVEFVAGRSVGSSADLAQLLRKRLLVVAIVGAVVNGVDRALSVVVEWPLLAADALGRMIDRPIYFTALAMFAVCTSLAFVLQARKEFSLSRLRMIEGVLFGTFAFTCAGYTWTAARIQTSYPAPIAGVLANSQILFWFACIMTYGFLVPNTARRCLAVVSGMVLAAVASMLGSWFYFGIAPAGLSGALANLVLWMLVAVAITVSGAHWFDQIRREALEARRLGQYVLRERLGAGGMGEVYLAEHLLLRRPAAIKLIRPERAGDPRNLARFEREVRTTATLTHPNTVQVFDYGHAEDGTFYYVMEYLPGLTLDQIVQAHGPVPPARAVHFLRQVCAALREAHGVGLIHRDIKPGNVMICQRGGIHDVAKLLDFGLVLPLGSGPTHEKLTQDGAITGTPTFMSPEQASGQEMLDARIDIYSVGALAYFLLTGKPPFAGRSGLHVLAAHLYEKPDLVTKHRPEVPDDLEAIVLRCLAKDPAERYQDAESLESALMASESAAQWTAQQAAAWWHSQPDPDGHVGEQRINDMQAPTTSRG